MIKIWWFAAIWACAAQPRPAEPIAGAGAPGVERASPTSPPALAGPQRIQFGLDGVGISATETAVLDTVVQRLNADPALDLQISGHTDATGSTQPLDASHTEAAWAKNRRIAFLILKRSP